MIKLNEKQIVDLFISKFRVNSTVSLERDDVAIVSLKKTSKTTMHLILKCDMLVEHTDVPEIMLPWQIARKSIVSCISDLSAKGIRPYVCLISIGIPKKYSKAVVIEDLTYGFQVASREFDVQIVGGDTNESNELIIDCCMIGFSYNKADIPRRNGAEPGDLIVVSGKFGYSSSGLKILMNNAKAYGEFRKKAIKSVTQPQPQQRFGISLAKYFSSSIDSSDGLSISLYELANQSGVNFILDNIPAAKGVKDFAEDNQLNYKNLIFHGGEEYEIVATIPQSNIKTAKSIARESKLKLYVIGKVEEGDGKVFLLNETKKKCSLLKNRGYIHFR